MDKKMINTYIYTRYERLWHWAQMVMIMILLVTGMEINGFYKVLGFYMAAKVHSTTALIWLGSFAFFVFWIMTTGEWKQYIPTTKKVLEVMRYYAFGIFKGEEHPVPKRKDAKHNPLQRIAYLSLAAILLPVQMLTGFLYWSYNSWEAWGLGFMSLGFVATLHMICAFAILQFVLVHVYMTTTGHSPSAHIRAMITGWEEIREGERVEDWESR